MSTTNEIEKMVDLKAPVDRVWHAITDAREFGSWFGPRIRTRTIAVIR
jgi:uncharacterized protein YndB with AHSA1/START domain